MIGSVGLCCNYKRIARNNTHFRNHATTNSRWLLLSFRTFALPLFLTSLTSRHKSTSMEEGMVFLSTCSSLWVFTRTWLIRVALSCLVPRSEAVGTKTFSKHLLHGDLLVNRGFTFSRKVVSIAETTPLLGLLLPSSLQVSR